MLWQLDGLCRCHGCFPGASFGSYRRCLNRGIDVMSVEQVAAKIKHDPTT